MLVIVVVAPGLDLRPANEDLNFMVKTMVVQAAWPGATVRDMLKQIRTASRASCRKRRAQTTRRATPAREDHHLRLPQDLDAARRRRAPPARAGVREKVRDISNTPPRQILPGSNS